MRELKFSSMPTRWEDGLPVGNGRLAAMLWGKREDILSLNHEWIWTGRYRERANYKSAQFLPEVRALLDAGEFFRANALAAVAFGGNGGISSLPRRMDSYQPAGELVISTGETPLSVVRTLDMEHGTVTSEKKYADKTVALTTWCDAVQDVVCAQVTASSAATLRLQYRREAQEGAVTALQTTKNGFRFDCDMGAGVSFAVQAQIFTDGVLTRTKSGLCARGATQLSVVLNIGTQHSGIEQELAKTPLAEVCLKTARTRHAQVFAAQMNRCRMQVEDGQPTPQFIDEHVRDCRQKKQQSAYLITAYARLAQYLMVAGSLCGELPLNLQGKWNRALHPKWNSDYHLNINLQMNYWFAHRMGWHEYSRQMLHYVTTLLPKARAAAQDLYGCGGVLYPLNSDIWGNCTAEAYNYSVWVGAAGWLCRHFMEYYHYTQDTEALRDTVYPFVRETVRFYEDYFTFASDGTVKIQPSQSPENKFAGGGYFPVSVCTNAAMDVQIAYETLSSAVECAQTLGVDAQDAVRWQALLEKLPPFGIGADGRLLEWDSDDKRELEEGHRHVSHLYGVYPAQLFTPEQHVAQFEAARKSLEHRLAHSGAHTGWSCAWTACLFARFLDGEAVQDSLQHLACALSSQTLLDLHPNYYPKSESAGSADTPVLFTRPAKDPPMIFQIDGNLGAAAALCEALVQVRDGAVHLLCAVPALWRTGSVEGMALPGGHTLSFAWNGGALTRLGVTLGAQEALRFAPLPLAAQQTLRAQPGVSPDALCGGGVCVAGAPGETFVLIGEKIGENS